MGSVFFLNPDVFIFPGTCCSPNLSAPPPILRFTGYHLLLLSCICGGTGMEIQTDVYVFQPEGSEQ